MSVRKSTTVSSVHFHIRTQKVGGVSCHSSVQYLSYIELNCDTPTRMVGWENCSSSNAWWVALESEGRSYDPIDVEEPLDDRGAVDWSVDGWAAVDLVKVESGGDFALSDEDSLVH